MDNLPKNTFGLNINNSALTAVELSFNKKALKVVNFARVELEPGIVEDDCIIVDPEAFKEALGRLLKEGYAGPITSRNVIISVPEEKTFTHRLYVPHEHAHDDEYIAQSAKDFIPIELAEAVTDYCELATCSSKKEVRFNFVAMQRSIVESIISVLAEVGLKVVYVDVDKNSLIRACDNRFQRIDGDFMIVNINDIYTTLSVNGKSGVSYTQDSDIAGDEFIKKIKENSQLTAASDVRNVLAELAKDPEAPAKEQYQAIQNILKEAYGMLIKKIEDLTHIAESQDDLKIKTIYLIGSHSRMPGLAETFKQAFPEVNIIPKFQYIQLDEGTELFYTKAIGLALKAALQEIDADEIDLLPQHKKIELFHRKLTPVMMKSFLSVCICLAGAILFSGFTAAKAYLGLKISEKEVEISIEKSQNPYLRRVAQYSQQKTQLESQISTILKDAIPPGEIMEKVDYYNFNGISLINASYKLNRDGSNDIRFRAKTQAREETEKFVKNLEKDTYFSKVMSPLSNLTGKGERFININLEADADAIIAEAEQSDSDVSKTETTPKTPAKSAPKIKVPKPAEDTIEDPIAVPSLPGSEQVAGSEQAGEEPVEDTTDETTSNNQ